MFYMDPVFAAVSVLIHLAIITYVKSESDSAVRKCCSYCFSYKLRFRMKLQCFVLFAPPPQAWGDATRGFLYHLASVSLLKLSDLLTDAEKVR